MLITQDKTINESVQWKFLQIIKVDCKAFKTDDVNFYVNKTPENSARGIVTEPLIKQILLLLQAKADLISPDFIS